MYTDESEQDLVLIQGNIWDAFKRIKHQALEDKNTEIVSNQQDNESSEESWAASEDEDEKQDNNLKVPAKPQILLRSSTYHLRKENVLYQLHKNDEDTVSFESDSDALEDSYKVEQNLPAISIGGFAENESIQSKKKNVEKETLNLMNKLFINKAINVTKDMLTNEDTGLLKPEVDSLNKTIADFNKPVDLSDIILEIKEPNEAKQSVDQVLSSINTIIFKNKISTKKKKGRSSIGK